MIAPKRPEIAGSRVCGGKLWGELYFDFSILVEVHTGLTARCSTTELRRNIHVKRRRGIGLDRLQGQFRFSLNRVNFPSTNIALCLLSAQIPVSMMIAAVLRPMRDMIERRKAQAAASAILVGRSRRFS